MPLTRCIIGCGTYGSYLLSRLSKAFPQDEIIVLELGDHQSLNEKESGLHSDESASHAARSGRYFGLGGTSARWGGQILFFDKRDNPSDQPVWNKIIANNEQYKSRVIEQLFGDTAILPLLAAHDKNNCKTGIWLKYTKRNLFKKIKLSSTPNTILHTRCRVTSLEIDQGCVRALCFYDQNGETKQINADIFYLTAGAIESCRILLDLSDKGVFQAASDLGKNLGDHLSVELFRVKNATPVLSGINLVPIWHKGSLITKRLLVYTSDGRVGYIQGIFNKNIRIFTILKQLMFGKKQSDFCLTELLSGLLFLIKLGWSILIKKRLYVDQREWSIQLDIEQQFPNTNAVRLSQTMDKFGVPGVALDWQIDPRDRTFINEVHANLNSLLSDENMAFVDTLNATQSGASKLEDVYHPVGFMRMGTDINAVTDLSCKVHGMDNLYHFSTALFPSAKSINPTAAAFCLIEAHIDSQLVSHS